MKFVDSGRTSIDFPIQSTGGLSEQAILALETKGMLINYGPSDFMPTFTCALTGETNALLRDRNIREKLRSRSLIR